MKTGIVKGKDIEAVVRAGLCTGCGTCVALCSRRAIGLSIDQRKGLYVPRVDRGRCNDCGLCFAVCPGHSVDFPRLSRDIFGKEPEDMVIGNYCNCYLGHATDRDIRYNAASGGLVTALLLHALEEGVITAALVTRMNPDRPLEPEPFIARTKEEIVAACGSKYCPVPANIALGEVLREEGQYAIVGLPCHIHGLRRAETANQVLRRRVVLHLSLMCGHSDSFLARNFLLKRHGINKEEVGEFHFRGLGWPGAMQICLRDGRSRLVPYGDYINLHWLHFFALQRCHVCVDHMSSLADITFMDAWLPEVMAEDRLGTSIIISRTPAADALCQSAKSKRVVELTAVTQETVLRSQGREALAHNDDRANFLLLRLARKATPDYGFSLPRSGIRNHLRAVLMHFNMWVSGSMLLRGLVNPLEWLEVRLLRRSRSRSRPAQRVSA